MKALKKVVAEKIVRTATVLLAVLTLIITDCNGITLAILSKAQGQGTVYYIDGANGSDSASGTSPSKAWKTLSRVNSTVFSAGDKILFKAGTTYSGQLYPKGSGSKDAPVTVDMYGTGAKPIIFADGRNKSIVTLYNQEYFEISNLELTSNNNPDVTYAVNFIAKDYGTVNHIYIKNCYIHNISGSLTSKITGGIFFTVSGTAIKTNYNDILVENNTLRTVDRTGITFDAFRSWNDKRLGEYEAETWYPSTNVVIRGNFIDDIGGDGIVVKCCLGALVEYNTAKNCNARSTDANVAIWTYTSTGTVLQYNEAYNTRYTHDGEGFDVDSFSEDTVVQYNYSHDNEGGFILVCAPGDTAGTLGYYTKNTTVRYNISQNDGNLGIMYSGNITNTDFYNNTLYIGEGNTTQPINSWDWGGAWAKGGIFANNLIYNLGTGDYNLGGIDIDIKNNIYYGNHPLTEPDDKQKITQDPKLVAPGSGGFGIYTADGYMLCKDSVALCSGIPINNCGDKDYFGNAINKSKPNIGAYGGEGVTETAKKGTDKINGNGISYIYPINVDTVPDKAAAMPKYVPVRLHNGKTELVRAYWEETAAFDLVGAYTVYGSIKCDGGKDVKISANVTVQKQLVDVFEKIMVINSIADWKISGDKNASYIDAIGYSGKYCLAQYDRVPFKTTVSQKIENLENGLYTFKAFVNSSGTQNRSAVTVKGDKKYVGEIKKTNGFEYFEISDICVTDNKCEIKIYTDGNADSFLKVDETYLIKQDAQGVNFIKNSGFDIFDINASAAQNETKQTFAVYGTPQIDGVVDPMWDNAVTVDVEARNFTHVSGTKSTVSGLGKLMWDEKYLYVLVDVKDYAISYTNQSAGYYRDSVEVVLDERNEREGLWVPHNETCGQWRVGAKPDDLTGSGSGFNKGFSNFKGKSGTTENGYFVEMAVPFNELAPQVGSKIGFEIQINDDNGSGTRTGIVCWNSPLGESWQYTDVLGIVTFIKDKSQMEEFSNNGIEVGESDAKDGGDTDYSKYVLPVIIIASLILLITGADVFILIYRIKKNKR